MELPISGLQRLFHTGPSLSSAQSARKQLSLESVTEDAHTYDLLFPELSALRQTQNHAYPLRNGDPSSAALAANSHDDRGGLNIQTVRDVRIIIAQDGNLLGQQPKILYDSSPPPLSPVLRQGDGTEVSQSDEQRSPLQGMGLKRHNTGGQEAQTMSGPRHARGFSYGLNPELISPSSPEVEYRGAFSNPRLRRFGTRPVSSGSESLQSKIARERREETEALLGCMFGSTGFPMVSSTKLHIKPAGSSEVNSNAVNSPIAVDPISGRVPSRRSTPLTRSITVEDLHSYPPRLSEDVDQTFSKSKNASMLITRLFPVDLADSKTIQTPVAEASVATSTGESETVQESQNSASLAESEKAKQVKTPTYGIAIVLQLPPDRIRSFIPLVYTTTTAPSPHGNQLSHSPKGMDPSFGHEPLKPNEPSDNFDRNVEIVLDYWNIINRAISSLEVVLENKIKDLLINLETKYSRQPIWKPISEVGQFPKDKQKKVKQTSQQILYLPSNALQQSDVVRKEVDLVGKRVALALRTQKVIAGQGRWGIWREEARWIARWAGSREQNFFFFNLLTAFLGTHTEWLHLLGLRGFRRQHTRHAQRHRNDTILQQRTVIIASDKMAARRLVFLLSAFLPSTHINSTNEELNRPNSPWSNAAYSQSPPSGISALRQKPLRQTINRRQRGNRGGANLKVHERGVSFSDQDLPPSPGLISDVNRTALHSRRASDARSIRSLPLTISPTGDSTRKSSTTTTATIIPDTAVPIPHFSNVSPELLLGTSAEARPGSSGSFASLSLKHTLHRSEGTDRSNASTDSQSMSRWGSMMSFWSTRRGSSTDESDVISSSQEGLGISGISRERRNSRPLGKLAQMVEEVETPPKRENAKISRGPSNPATIPLVEDMLIQLPDQSTPARNIPERPNIEHFPMKLSVDENDGVIDIDLPMPHSFSSSFASSMSSLKASHTGASSFNDSSLHGRTSNPDSSVSGSGLTIDVVGWLKNYHQDFSLQAVRPYRGLDEEIRYSMRAEKNQESVPLLMPLSNNPSVRPWTDICTTLVADAQNFSIHRLILRRRPALKSSTSNSATAAIEEEIVSEPIMDLDATLVDAVERVLAQSNQSSRTQSRTHSRTSSQAHSRTASPSHHDRHHRASDSPFLEVPRSECKKLVLGALEQVARSVGEEQEGRFYGKPTEGKDRIVDNTLREGVRRWLNGAGDGI